MLIDTCKIRPPKRIRNDQMAYYNFYCMASVNILFPFIFHVQISGKNTYNENSCQMSILSFNSITN